MKRWIGVMCACMMLGASPALAQAPKLPEQMLPAQEIRFPAGQKYAVYMGPGEEYARAGDGKASVSTNDWIQVFGQDGAWLMIQYAISDGRMRIGYMPCEALPEEAAPLNTLTWEWRAVRTTADAWFSDDPFGKRETILTLRADTSLMRLGVFGEWAYVETMTPEGECMRGFVSAALLEEEAVAWEKDAAFVSAMQFLKDAGIEAEPTGIRGETLYLALKNGGTARYWHYGDGYSIYEMNWRFSGASDADIARYLDANLSALAQVEFGHLQAEWLTGEYAEWNRNATVSNGLGYLESLGDQGLSILGTQLAAHDGNDELNSLRARLASRMLGTLDATGVSPEEGCAWYDALTLRTQDALPPVDASAYVEDPVLQQVTQEMIAYVDAYKTGWSYGRDVDMSKTRNLACIHAHKMREEGQTLTVWGVLEEGMFALYDGTLARQVCGSYVPCRMTFDWNDGAWKLKEAVRAEDGGRYAPSIRAFCEGDSTLADALMREQSHDLSTAFAQYLRANGYESIVWE